MAVLESSVVRKNNEKQSKMNKKNEKTKDNVSKDVILTAQELKFIKYLAANDPKDRKKALKALPKWLEDRSKTKAFREEDFMLMWKGLFYNMWMSDKPLVQEQCAEDISNLVHSFSNADQAILFFKAGLQTLINEWFGIDQLRLDKFLMFVRRILRQIIFVLKKNSFKKKVVVKQNDALENTILTTKNDNIPMGLLMHFIEIYLEEIAKVSEGNYHPEITTNLIRPFIKKMAVAKDSRILNCIRRFVFYYLIRQHDLGIEYQIKYDAWRSQNFEGSIDSIQKIKISNEDQHDMENDDENDEIEENIGKKPLDPRAGKIDVELPQIKFIPRSIVDALSSVKFGPETNIKSREEIKNLTEKFQKLQQGVYPLGIKRVHPKKRKHDDSDTNISKAAKRLIKFENKLLGKTGKNKNKRKRKYEDTEPSEDIIVPTKKSKIENKKNKNKKQPSENLEKRFKKSKNATGPDIISNNLNKVQKKNLKNLKKKKADVNKKNILKAVASNNIDDNNLEYMFKRNSGTWFVFNNEENKRNKQKIDKLSPHKEDIVTKKISPRKNKNKPNNGSPKLPQISNGTSPKKESPKRGNISPKSPKTPENSIFGKPGEWDEELKEGEYEFFVSSKKYLRKLKNKDISKSVDQIFKKSQKNTKITTSPRTPGTKKVVFNEILNRAQEVSEHVHQIRMSPHIPYDSSKKPGKPLLKTPIKASPINPFYRSRLSF